MLKFSEEIKGKVFHRDRDDSFIIFDEFRGEEVIYIMNSDTSKPGVWYPLCGFVYSITQKEFIWGLRTDDETTLTSILFESNPSGSIRDVSKDNDISFNEYEFDNQNNLFLVIDEYTKTSITIKGRRFANYIHRNIIDTKGVPLSEIV